MKKNRRPPQFVDNKLTRFIMKVARKVGYGRILDLERKVYERDQTIQFMEERFCILRKDLQKIMRQHHHLPRFKATAGDITRQDMTASYMKFEIAYEPMQYVAMMDVPSHKTMEVNEFTQYIIEEAARVMAREDFESRRKQIADDFRKAYRISMEDVHANSGMRW